MQTKHLIIAVVVLALATIAKSAVDNMRADYARLSRMLSGSFAKVGEGIDQAIATAKSAEKTSDSAREILEDLRSRIVRLESASSTAMQAKQSEIDSLVDQLDKEQQRRTQAELTAEQATQSMQLMKKTPQVTTAGPRIVMHSGVGCGPCEQWKRDSMPAWRAKGWTVEVIEETKSDRWWPWFEIYEGGRRFEVDGPLTQESYNRAKK